MTAGLDSLADRAGPAGDQPLSAAVVRLAASAIGAGIGTRRLKWPNAAVTIEEAGGYQVRLSATAIREMRAESARGARVRGQAIETGGMLLGEIDDACRCIWIDMATGPPPDSKLSAWHFDHGTDGVQELVDHYQARSRQITLFVGMWHTHPCHAAQPSPTDRAGMQQILAPAGLTPPRMLMIILGGGAAAWSTWLQEGLLPDIYARLVRHDPASPQQPPAVPAEHGRQAWPGGFAIQTPTDQAGLRSPTPAARVRALLRRLRRQPPQR
jgi:integrative and conjugative element protein (TIGR02256 family)